MKFRPLRICRGLFVCLLGLSLASVPIPASAQQEDHSKSVHHLTVLVDGKKTPAAISDDIAWSHMLVVIAEHQNATPEELRRRESRITKIQLLPSDALALVNAIAGLREQLDSIDNLRARDGNSQALNARWNALMTSTRARVRAALTADGLARLETFIREEVKPAIVIYGSN